MELKDLIALAPVVGAVAAAAAVLVAWIKHRHDVRVQKEELEPRPAKPFAVVIYTVTCCSNGPDRHSLRLEISNREERPIAVKEVYWHVKSFKTSWPLSYDCPSLPELGELSLHKLETADHLQLDIDIRDIFAPFFGSRELSTFDTIVAIAALDVGVVLTTGEAISRRTPWTLRAFLAGRFVRPSWLVPFVRLYIWARP